MPAGQCAGFLTKTSQDSLDNVGNLGKPASAFFAAGHVAVRRTHCLDAAGAKPRQIFLRRGMSPHGMVHRRCDQHRRQGRQKNCGGQIIGKPVCRPGHQIGRCRHDQNEIGLTSQPDMAHLRLISQRKQVGENLLACQCRQAEWRDELLCASGHHTGDPDVVILKPSRHLECLVGGNATADDQQYPLAHRPGADDGRHHMFTGDFKACWVNLVATCAQGRTDRPMRPLRQRPFRQIIADGAGADPEKVLKRLPPAKSGDQRGKVTIFHISPMFE